MTSGSEIHDDFRTSPDDSDNPGFCGASGDRSLSPSKQLTLVELLWMHHPDICQRLMSLSVNSTDGQNILDIVNAVSM